MQLCLLISLYSLIVLSSLLSLVPSYPSPVWVSAVGEAEAIFLLTFLA